MDVLIKNNVVKQDKIIVDIGEFAIKVLSVHYVSKRVEISEVLVLDSGFFFENGSFDYSKIACKLNAVLKGRGKKNITIILPNSITETKIVAIKNKKESDLGKVIEGEYSVFGKASKQTHVVDYGCIGKREELGDTVNYCLLSAAPKTAITEIINAFKEYGLRVTTVLPLEATQICLSELYFDDYDDLNRLVVDFGTRSTRITAFSDNVAVYTRTIDYGYQTYLEELFSSLLNAGKPEIKSVLPTVGCDREQSGNPEFLFINENEYFECVDSVNEKITGEIMRVIDMCVNNDVDISKIYYTGFVIPGFDGVLSASTGLACQNISINCFEEKYGKDYCLAEETGNISSEFSNAIGAAIYPVV